VCNLQIEVNRPKRAGRDNLLRGLLIPPAIFSKIHFLCTFPPSPRPSRKKKLTRARGVLDKGKATCPIKTRNDVHYSFNIYLALPLNLEYYTLVPTFPPAFEISRVIAGWPRATFLCFILSIESEIPPEMFPRTHGNGERNPRPLLDIR